MAIHALTQSFLATKLVCPADKKKIEICDSVVPGLFIEVRSAAGSVPTWYWRFKDHAGKTRSRSIGTLTDLALGEARKQVKLLKAQHALGQADQAPAHDPAQGITLDRFMHEHYFPHARAHKRSYKRDDQLYRLRIAARFGHLPLRQITRRDVQKFHADLPAQGLSLASANHHLQLLRRVLNVAVSWEMLERNVLEKVTLFTLDNQVENYLDDEQVDRLVGVLQTDENRMVCLILLFLLSTGARLNEALWAEWKQVDLDNAAWRIPASNSKSKRVKSVPLNDSALWVIRQLGTQGTSRYLFPSPATGKPFTTITRVWYRIRRKAGLPANVRIHDLRHTYASRLVSRGRSLYEVQQLLGHADPRTSLRYAHLSMKAKQEAAQAAAFRLGS